MGQAFESKVFMLYIHMFLETLSTPLAFVLPKVLRDHMSARETAKKFQLLTDTKLLMSWLDKDAKGLSGNTSGLRILVGLDAMGRSVSSSSAR
ncbi:MAG: hypothetical protein Q9195_001584 [Heterodermia aff. obscurata]